MRDGGLERCAYPRQRIMKGRKRGKKVTKKKERYGDKRERERGRKRITTQKFKILALEDVTARIIATYGRYRRYTFIIENEMGEKIV